MWRIYFYLGLFSLISLLTACNTLNANNQKAKEEQQRRISTAKINVQLGLAYLESQNLQRAKRKLALALEQGPTIPEPWYSMAYFYEATGEKETAKRYYLKAIALAPFRGDTNNNYGTFLCRQGKYRESIQQFMVAVKDEDYLDPASAYENAGLCAAKIPDKKLAAHYLERAIQQDPNRPLSLYKLASLYYDQGKFTAARTKMTQFSAISPHTAQTLELRSKIESKLFAQNQVNYVANISFKNFLMHEKAKTAKPIIVADKDKSVLRKKFLKPAAIKIIPLRPTQAVATKTNQNKKMSSKDPRVGKIVPYTKLAMKKEEKIKQKTHKNKNLRINRPPKALAKIKTPRKNDKLLSRRAIKTSKPITDRHLIART